MSENAPNADDAGKETPPGDAGNKNEPNADKGKAPKFEGEFDAERAAKLVENLRADVAKRDADLKALKAQIEEKGGSEKTLQQRLDALESRAAEAERSLLVARVAKEQGVPDDLLEFLTGKDEAALKTQAERLAAHAKKQPADDVPRRPRPRLTPGHNGEDEEKFDADAVAKAARRR